MKLNIIIKKGNNITTVYLVKDKNNINTWFDRLDFFEETDNNIKKIVKEYIEREYIREV